MHKPEIHNCCNCAQKSLLFNCLTNDELIMMNEAKTRVNFNAGEIIVKQGAPMSHVISFTNGLARVYIEGQQNRNLILQFVKPTEFLGGPGIYTDKKHYFSVSAVVDSSVCFIDINVFKEIIAMNQKFSEAFIRLISTNGIFNYNRFISLTHKNMHGRIADSLIYFKEEIFMKEGEIITISNQDFADFTGMSKDSVIRTLKELTKDAIITNSSKGIQIKNLEQLRKISALA